MKIPFYQAVTQRNMVAGIPRNVAVLMGTFAAAMFFGLQSLFILPVLAVLWTALHLLYKQDDYFLEILIQHIKERDYFLT